ncbi:MAG: hypothetical protein O3A92_06820 [Verrucomicrobia bacterium]|nr:hypothetical protein [Verrucomicrobiota bacterium]
MNMFGKVGQAILPQHHGARRWAEEYGEKLVRVRYRYDSVAGLRHTTVEIAVDSAPWQPALQPTALIHVAYDEEKLRHLLKARGATWEPALRRWRVPLPLVQELQLENRLDSPPPAS